MKSSSKKLIVGKGNSLYKWIIEQMNICREKKIVNDFSTSKERSAAWIIKHLENLASDEEKIALEKLYQAMHNEEKQHNHYDTFINAVRQGFPSIVALLLANNSVLKKIESNHNNAILTLAVQKGNIEVIRILLDCPHIINTVTCNNVFVLRLAAANGHVLILKEFMQLRDVDVYITALNNQALKVAIKKGHFDCVRMLLENKHVQECVRLDIDNDALGIAAENNRIDIAKYLLQFPYIKQNIKANDDYALLAASENDYYYGFVRLLLKSYMEEAISSPYFKKSFAVNQSKMNMLVNGFVRNHAQYFPLEIHQTITNYYDDLVKKGNRNLYDILPAIKKQEFPNKKLKALLGGSLTT